MSVLKKMPLNIIVYSGMRGTACLTECVLKTLACRGLRVGPSKDSRDFSTEKTHFVMTALSARAPRDCQKFGEGYIGKGVFA